MKSRLAFSILMTLTLLLAACTSATPSEPAAQPTVQATQPPTTVVTAEVTEPVAAPTDTTTPAGLTIELGQTAELGEFLVDGEGMTLYLFTRDTPNTSTCYDDCALAWPPLLADVTPVAGVGVDATLLGVTPRTDGAVQVTYNGWPLYYFATDMQPGDTAGQDVNGVWFVVSAAGEQVPPLSGAGSSNSNMNSNLNDNMNDNSNDNSNDNDNVNGY